MKGGVFALRGAKLAFILVTLVCTTIIILGWDKAPFIVSFLPRSQPLNISPDVFFGSPVQETHQELTTDVGNIAPKFATNETSDKPIDKVSQTPSYSPKKYKGVCNFAKGNWVADEHRPFYSRGRCLQWLSEMWACRLSDRIDFKFEKFRWQPIECEMNEFSGQKFLRRMRNKTLAFIGDSLGRQQFQSLMCMITAGKERRDVIDVGWEYGLVKARGAIRPDGWAYSFTRTNATVLFYWSACLCDLQPLNQSDQKFDIAMHLSSSCIS